MTKLIIFLLMICFIAFIIYKSLPLFFFMKANKKYSENNLNEAMQLYEKAYKFKHSSPSIKIMYSFVLIRNGYVDTAEKILDEISKVKLLPKDEISAELNRSLIMWKKNDLDKAIELLEQLMSKGYKNSIIYQNLGYYLILKGDYSKALEFNKEAYEYSSDDVGLLDNLAMNYYFMEEYERAAEIYSKIISKSPSFATTYYYYAKILKAQCNFKEALEMLNRALSCNFSFISPIDKECIENEIKSIEASLNN